MTTRPRRLRRTQALRALVQETHLRKEDLVLPLFIHHGENIERPIASLPGQFQYSVDRLKPILNKIREAGILAVMLFGVPETKDVLGDSAKTGPVIDAIRTIKQHCPELLVMADVCLCEYTTHGHCGVIDLDTQTIHNDATLPHLAEQSIAMAQAGADIIAPSGMMDGVVAAIRKGLDGAGFTHIPILSYAVKYHSAFYGPFRDAVDSAPQFGDRASYQMNPANQKEAFREAALDVAEGADCLMVKPASHYLDVIALLKQKHPSIPMAAYHVSGEYAAIMAAMEKGWLSPQAMFEALLSIKRAGADVIITYAALDIAQHLSNS